jgi:hypothetical protein
MNKLEILIRYTWVKHILFINIYTGVPLKTNKLFVNNTVKLKTQWT